jgi:hypothetical protein
LKEWRGQDRKEGRDGEKNMGSLGGYAWECGRRERKGQFRIPKVISRHLIVPDQESRRIEYDFSCFAIFILRTAALLKKKGKFSSYIRKFRRDRCKVIYD